MATRLPRLPAPLPEQLPHPCGGYRSQSWWGWSWARAVRDGPWVVRDPEGALVARARTRWTAARWACAQRRGEDGAS